VIEILGVLEGQEYEAALHVRRLLLKLWPDLAQSREDIVKIFVGFKMYGYKVEDLDLIVVGQFASPRAFDVEWKFYPPTRLQGCASTGRSLQSATAETAEQPGSA
jgi:hypothetical protein